MNKDFREMYNAWRDWSDVSLYNHVVDPNRDWNITKDCLLKMVQKVNQYSSKHNIFDIITTEQFVNIHPYIEKLDGITIADIVLTYKSDKLFHPFMFVRYLGKQQLVLFTWENKCFLIPKFRFVTRESLRL